MLELYDKRKSPELIAILQYLGLFNFVTSTIISLLVHTKTYVSIVSSQIQITGGIQTNKLLKPNCAELLCRLNMSNREFSGRGLRAGLIGCLSNYIASI